MIRVLRGIVRVAFVVILLGTIAAGAFVAITLSYFGRDLPSHQQLANYVPATGTKIYAGDGSFMSEFATERRIVVPLAKIPKLLIQAVLAAEDRDFYTHNGVNPGAMFRAAMADVTRFQKGQRPLGASTITQQVVRHFMLTNEVSVKRKIKEILLAYRIERELSKNQILDIYLNEIYLGAGAYGVAAAADTYFQKPLDQLTLAETAFLAALPKAPNNYNPIRHPGAAKARRDWVLNGMVETGAITQAQAKAAVAEPLGVHLRPEPEGEATGYFAEEVRRELIARFGEKTVYEGGLKVRTSYVPSYQKMAEAAFRKGLVEYDRRHGWRGPLAHLANGPAAQAAMATIADPGAVAGWQMAAVTATDAGGATIALKSGGIGRVPLEEMRWARRTLADQRVGAGIRGVHDVVSPGDIILVEPVAAAAPAAAGKGRHAPAAPAVATYGLRQVPDVSGGVVVMDPKTGRVFATVGGWSFQQSQFNRTVQAKRQPGSAFKPFVFVTALQNGFTPQSTVEDAPIEISQGPGLPPWRPVNYEGNYVGTTTLEDALIHSRNLVTARLATMIGLPAIAQTVQNFDIMDRMPLYYSMALGAGETTLLRLTNAYAMLDNGGHWLLPSVIDLVQDREGRILYQKGVNGCAACFVAAGKRNTPDTNQLYRPTGYADSSSIYVPNAKYAENAMVYKPTKRDPLVDANADYELLSMMQGVVQRGTGTAVAAVGKPIAGKTGTTSDWFDAWFVGFSPDLVAGVYVGFDDPRTLGEGETGGHVAAPIFRDFMMAALKDMPAKPFPTAPGQEGAVVASAQGNATADSKTGSGSSKASKVDLASLTDPTTINPDDPANNPDYGTTKPKVIRGNSSKNSDPYDPQNTASLPPYPDYGANADPRTPDYSYAAPASAYAAPAPSYGSSAYAAPVMPSYPAAQSYGSSAYAAPVMPRAPEYAAPRTPDYGAYRAPDYGAYRAPQYAAQPAQPAPGYYYVTPRAPDYGYQRAPQAPSYSGYPQAPSAVYGPSPGVPRAGTGGLY